MQQLRRDCERIRNLLDLVRHREKVKQISLVVNEEVFEQQMHDLTSGSGEARAVNIDVSSRGAHPSRPSQEYGPAPFPISTPPTSSHHFSAAQLDELRQKLSAPRALTGLDIEKKVKRSKKNRKRALDEVDGDEEDVDDDGAGLSDGSRPERSMQGGEKKAKAPRPSVPSFMEPYATRATYELPGTLNFPRVSMFCGDDEDAAAAVGEAGRSTPVSYSCRGRIGRGGRVIFDRVPIRTDAASNPPGVPVPCVYPRMIGSGAGGRYRRLPSGFQQELRRKVRVDPQKIHHVYNLSDSEDEELKPGVSSSQANLGHGVSLKFELRV